MIWKPLVPDVRPKDLAPFLRTMGFVQASRLIFNFINKPAIHFAPWAYESIIDHITSGIGERGGLLVGKTHRLPFITKHGYAFHTNILKALPSIDFVSTGFSLKMGTELWSRAAGELKKEQLIVGWYHSHPNLGAFFSSIDRDTQKAFFNQDYSLGIVIDPNRHQSACFAGPDAMEIEINWPRDWNLIYSPIMNREAADFPDD